MSKVIYIKCNKANYDNTPRSLSSILGYAIHGTGNKNDTAVNNGKYFQREIVYASAHYIIDGYGTIVKSVPYSRTAWAVQTPGMKLKGKLNNSNTISIELCDIKDKYPTKKQIAATRWLIKYLNKRCVNAKNNIVRHYDICGKLCPNTMVDDKVWKKFLKDLNL